MASSNTEFAYNHIRKKILDGECLPGNTLNTIDLAKEAGVSSTPVRDALRKLESDGLVVIGTRTGAVVRQISAAEYGELCQIRQALESFGAGLAAKQRSEEDLAEIKRHLDEMSQKSRQLAQAKTPLRLLPRVARVDSRFHLAIMAASRNQSLYREMIRLHLIFRVVAGRQRTTLRVLPAETSWRSRRLEIHREHEAIFLGIAERDAKAAREAMELHIQRITQDEVVALEREEKLRLENTMGI